MKGVPWGPLYNQFKDETLDTDKLEEEVAKLMMDEDVQRKPGIYSYVLDGDEKHLSIRAFSPNMKREAYERQKRPPDVSKSRASCEPTIPALARKA